MTEEQKERKNDAKECIHWTICPKLFETYKAKNADYGDSFAQVREKYPNAILIGLNDKLKRNRMAGDSCRMDAAAKTISGGH